MGQDELISFLRAVVAAVEQGCERPDSITHLDDIPMLTFSLREDAARPWIRLFGAELAESGMVATRSTEIPPVGVSTYFGQHAETPVRIRVTTTPLGGAS